MLFVTYGITVGTPVPKTSGGYAILASIARVLNVMAQTGMRMVWVGAGYQVVIFQVFVGELLQGLLALLVIAPG